MRPRQIFHGDGEMARASPRDVREVCEGGLVFHSLTNILWWVICGDLHDLREVGAWVERNDPSEVRAQEVLSVSFRKSEIDEGGEPTVGLKECVGRP
jgi:hypothetical protein